MKPLFFLCLGLLCGVVTSLRAGEPALSQSKLVWQDSPAFPAPPSSHLAVVAPGAVLVSAEDAARLKLTWWPHGAAAANETTIARPAERFVVGASRDELLLAFGDGSVRAVRLTKSGAESRELPSLPAAIDGGAWAVAGNTAYFLSAATGVVSLNLAIPQLWLAHGGEGGPPTAELDRAVAAVRWDDLAYRDALAVFTPSAAWRFTPGPGGGWTKFADMPASFVPRSATAVGPTHVFLADGDGGLLCFHVLTRSFTEIPTSGAPALSVAGNASGVWAVAEDRVVRGRVVTPTQSLRWMDWLMIALYLGGMVWIGTWFSKEKAASGYFLGGRQIPWWAAGLSIWATGVSAISFMAIPAKTYATNWHRIAEPMGNVIVLVGGALIFIPLLRRLNLTTVMEHTEMRFHPSLRLVSTCFMVLGQIGGRMATTLLLPSMALSATTGTSQTVSILVMGIVTTVYTAMGGFKAVIWTDVAQSVLMLGGALLTLCIVVFQVPGGFGGVIEITREFDKFRPFDWTPDLTTATVYVFGLWTVGQLMGGVGQEFAQRAFATKSVRAAQRSMYTAALVSIPGTIIFFSTGTALFAFYHTHSTQLPPLLANDNIVPLFVVQNVPAGIAGLIIAGIFGAAMSTLSGMNSVATVVVRDFYRFSGRASTDEREVRLARVVTYVCGALATGAALYMSQLTIASLWDNFSRLMAVLGGGMAGVGALGMLTTRANTFGVYCSIVVGSAWVLFIATSTRLHFAIFGVTTLAVCFVTGYVASVIYAKVRGLPPQDLSGLTVWTTKPNQHDG